MWKVVHLRQKIPKPEQATVTIRMMPLVKKLSQYYILIIIKNASLNDIKVQNGKLGD